MTNALSVAVEQGDSHGAPGQYGHGNRSVRIERIGVVAAYTKAGRGRRIRAGV